MGRSVKLSMLLSLLFFFTDYLQAEEIEGTKGKNITIRFTFKGNLNNNFTFTYANLHKNRSKIEESNKMPMDNRRNFSLISREPILYISNLRTTDAGEYYVSLYYKEPAVKLIESKRTILRIHVEEHITVTPPTSNHTGSVPSETTSSVYIPIITGIVVIMMILSSVLLGWQYLMHNKSTDCQLPHQEQCTQGAGAKCQKAWGEGRRQEELSTTTAPGQRGVLHHHLLPGATRNRARAAPSKGAVAQATDIGNCRRMTSAEPGRMARNPNTVELNTNTKLSAASAVHFTPSGFPARLSPSFISI
ncbi:uncharacterized protein LOC118229943 [Anguilla anguilla]|uniref:uncharacterized protein LOC118229943 n=1 Tax=Anguilla anguilla TaxID=7936 RepID=UPI0015ABA343|nr:uncharacterized protein LOC118229943 [Anguilla anguilla]